MEDLDKQDLAIHFFKKVSSSYLWCLMNVIPSPCMSFVHGLGDPGPLGPQRIL
jgi:hypothetical protein